MPSVWCVLCLELPPELRKMVAMDATTPKDFVLIFCNGYPALHHILISAYANLVQPYPSYFILLVYVYLVFNKCLHSNLYSLSYINQYIIFTHKYIMIKTGLVHKLLHILRSWQWGGILRGFKPKKYILQLFNIIVKKRIRKCQLVTDFLLYLTQVRIIWEALILLVKEVLPLNVEMRTNFLIFIVRWLME